jgi:cytochrome c
MQWSPPPSLQLYRICRFAAGYSGMAEPSNCPLTRLAWPAIPHCRGIARQTKVGRVPVFDPASQGEIMTRTLMLIAAGLAVSTTGSLAQDVAAGEQSFKKCLPCHSVGEDAKNKVGPLLNGLEGRKSGTIEGYTYTEANKNSGIVWSDDTFKEYIKDPRAKIPGTKMVFAGIKNEKEIGDLWTYLKQFDAGGHKK